jgi:hypothetical protein
MLTKPYTRVARQIVYNHKLEQIINYEDPKGEYVDPTRLLDQKIFAGEISFEEPDKIIPFLEILILRDTTDSFFHRLTLESDEDLTPDRSKQIGICLQEELSAFEKENFRTEGRMFLNDKSVCYEKAKKGSLEYARKFKLAQIIKKLPQKIEG